MEVTKNTDQLSACNNCLDREKSADVNIVIGGMSIKLCRSCKKELMEQLANQD